MTPSQSGRQTSASTCIALLRGINVGGRNRLPMKDLVAMLEGLGLESVKTYIQSGNVVFRTSEPDLRQLAERIGSAVNDTHGFEPRVLLLRLEELERAIRRNPFPEAEGEPKTLHLAFLESVPEAPDLEAMERIKAAQERFALDERVFYLHAPDGIGRSKLAEKFERLLGVAATSRNWRSVQKLRALAEG